jgi:hypothetical protein
MCLVGRLVGLKDTLLTGATTQVYRSESGLPFGVTWDYMGYGMA